MEDILLAMEYQVSSMNHLMLPAAYEALKKQGFKFINYEER